MSAQLKLVTPSNENRQVAPTRKPNAELRQREYLTEAEVERLLKAAKAGRHGHRDATLILIAFRHGLRAAEIAALEWSQVEFSRNPVLHVTRVKNGTPSVHPVQGDELRALRQLHRKARTPFVFETERATGFTPDAVNRQIKTIGERAQLPFPTHCHMLRHSCGYALANKGHDTRALQAWLGHRSIQHTVRYTELSPTRFRSFWK
jgi:type 1 fimbriae regulatory protein FimB/type 1 fimbriae regulatory protein FimE